MDTPEDTNHQPQLIPRPDRGLRRGPLARALSRRRDRVRCSAETPEARAWRRSLSFPTPGTRTMERRGPRPGKPLGQRSAVCAGQVRAPGEPGPRRNGGRFPRGRARAGGVQQARGREASARRRGRRPPPDVPRRGAPVRQIESPEHRQHVRGRRGEGAVLHRDGVPRRAAARLRPQEPLVDLAAHRAARRSHGRLHRHAIARGAPLRPRADELRRSAA